MVQTVLPAAAQNILVQDEIGLPAHDIMAIEIRSAVHSGRPVIVHAGGEMLWAALSATSDAGRKKDFVWIDRLRAHSTAESRGAVHLQERSSDEPRGAWINPFSFGSIDNHCAFIDALAELGPLVGAECEDALMPATHDLVRAIADVVLTGVDSRTPPTLSKISQSLVKPDHGLVAAVHRWRASYPLLTEAQYGYILQFLQVVTGAFGIVEQRSGGDADNGSIDPVTILQSNGVLAIPGEGAGQDGDLYDIYMREIILKLIDALYEEGEHPAPVLFTGFGTWSPRLDGVLKSRIDSQSLRHICLSGRLTSLMPEHIMAAFDTVISAAPLSAGVRRITCTHDGRASIAEYTPWPERYGFGEDLPDMPLVVPLLQDLRHG